MIERPTIVVLGFDTTYEMNRETKRRDREVTWVTYAPAHMAHYAQTRERIDFMNPANLRNRADDENGAKKEDFLRWRWAQIETAYNAWKQGHEIPIDGTPIAAWPGLNKAQADVFRAMGIKSVEMIAGMNDAVMGRVQLPGVRDIVAQAKAFLEASDRSTTANRLTELEEHNKALAERLEAAMALLEQQAVPEQKRGPGRPRKEVAEAA